MRAWRLNELGDPWDVLSLDEVESPSPGPGEARVSVSASDLISRTFSNVKANTKSDSTPRLHRG